MEPQKPKSLRNSTGGNVIDHEKRKREEKEGRKEGGAGNFDFQLASRFLSKSKPPGIHSLAQTSTTIPFVLVEINLPTGSCPRVPTERPRC
jgi:hypothetical protein